MSIFVDRRQRTSVTVRDGDRVVALSVAGGVSIHNPGAGVWEVSLEALAPLTGGGFPVALVAVDAAHVEAFENLTQDEIASIIDAALNAAAGSPQATLELGRDREARHIEARIKQ